MITFFELQDRETPIVTTEDGIQTLFPRFIINSQEKLSNSNTKTSNLEEIESNCSALIAKDSFRELEEYLNTIPKEDLEADSTCIRIAKIVIAFAKQDYRTVLLLTEHLDRNLKATEGTAIETKLYQIYLKAHLLYNEQQLAYNQLAIDEYLNCSSASKLGKNKLSVCY